ncbi:hypothetical protein NUW54_g7783 [Trametes sanguinea]|uniref:Uncharacterized protein n=1 Tax=Trametes sanguinea TaxID=158606 RepID=A0ACC1PHY4_9APHY|nr:hypothetical protein NUW54_g7783 [Trametes sanguinea]
MIELLITPLQFGIPNSRLRYYLLAKHGPQSFAGTGGEVDRVWRHIPGHGSDWVDTRAQSSEEATDAAVARSANKVLEKWGRLFDIVLPSSRRTCCFTRGYTKLVERAGSVLQMNEDLDTTTTFDAFLAAQHAGDEDAVRLLRPLRLRYFSPTELLRLFAFMPPSSTGDAGEQFMWPEDISTKTKYKLIGNSVNVRVVTELINYLFE